LIFAWLFLGWLNAAVFFYVAGFLFSKSKIRVIDVFGTLALAKAPLLIVAPLGLLPGLWNLDPQQLEAGQMQMEVIASLTIFGIVCLLVDILVVVWSYNAFAVSVNVKSKWLFTAVLIVSEIVAMILSGFMITWLPADKPVVIVVEPVEAVKPKDAEHSQHIEIAKRFVERIFAQTNDNPQEQFDVADVMKSDMETSKTRGAFSDFL
jgi:hypothetical protein